MEIFAQQSNFPAVHQEIDELQKYQTRLLAEKGVLAEDLEGYELPGYEHFKTRVLVKEKIRIALLRMTVDASKVYLHDKLQGQFNEVELLEKKKEDIEQDISVINRKISDANSKIAKLNKRLNSQIERH